MSTTTTITETDLRQTLRSIDSLTVANDYNVRPIDSVDEEVDYEGAEENFLPENYGVTGREPSTNPPNWLTDHRRMPPHRPPVYHPQWIAVGGPLPMRIFMWNMFVGCELLQV